MAITGWHSGARTTSRTRRLLVISLAVSLSLIADGFAAGLGAATTVVPKPVPSSELPPLPSDPPAPAPKPGPPPAAPPIGPYVRPTRGPEIPEQRSAHGTVYRNSDGTRTVVINDHPVHYRYAGAWRAIDTRLIADQSRAGTYRSSANSWVARFGPLPSGLEIDTGAAVLGFSPEEAAAVAPLVGETPDTVVYPDAWPGIDLRYRVTTDAVKEEIVLKRPAERSSFSYLLFGAGLGPDAENPGGAKLSGPAADEIRLAPPEVLDRAGRPVSSAGARLTIGAAGPGTAATAKVSVSVDASWLSGLAASDFPVVIDPTVLMGPDQTTSFKADGTQISDLGVRMGNVRDPGDNYWRTAVGFPYEQYFGGGARVVDANMAFTTNSGTTNSYTVEVRKGLSWSYGGGGVVLASGPLGSSATIASPQLTAEIDGWFVGQTSNVGLLIHGQETAGLYTYKNTSATLTLVLNYPPDPAVPLGPASGSTAVSLTPALGVHVGFDPDPGQTVSYKFEVATGSDFVAGALWNSGWITPRSVTPPSGTLRDGVSYFWRASTRDNLGLEKAAVGFRGFRVDRRLGDDPTQAYDPVGPVKVNLASGNLFLAASTPSISTVAGAAGVKLNYNSLAGPRHPSEPAYLNEGWTLEAGPGLGYHRARIEASSVVLVDATGVNHEYTKVSDTSYKPPAAERGVLAKGPDGNFTLHDSDGRTYVFGASDGRLLSASSAEDDRKPAAWTYTYSGALVTTVGDPVSQRDVVALAYQGTGTCPALPPAGFDLAPPGGHLCKVALADGRETKLWYSGGRLARIENPGGEITDFGYDSSNRISRLRDSLAADWVAVDPLTRDNDTTRTLIAYGSDARVSAVELPAPTPAALRPKHTYSYSLGSQTDGFYAYDQAFTGGTDVAAGDVLGDGKDEIVTAVFSNGTPHVKIFDKQGVDQTGGGFMAYSTSFLGGVRVAVGDVTGDSKKEIITGPGPGGGPDVRVFNSSGTQLAGFYAYDPAFTGGVDVATGDTDGDSKDEIITAPGSGGGPDVRTFEVSGSQNTGFYAYDVNMTSGVRVSSTDVDFDNTEEIVTGPGPDNGPHLRIWRPAGTEVEGFMAFDPDFPGGIDVAGTTGSDFLSVSTLSDDSAFLVPSDGSYFKLPFETPAVLTGGIHAALGDLDSNGAAETVIGVAGGAAPHVRVFAPTGVTDVHVVGLTETAGYARRVVYDGALRGVEDRDGVARATRTGWHASKDQVLAATDPAGRRSTTVYDAEDRPIKQLGPAPASWFGSDGNVLPAYSATVPATYTDYDESIAGLGASYWNNASLGAAPQLHATGTQDPSGAVNANWTTGGPPNLLDPGGQPVTNNWSGRYTGEIDLPATGNHTFRTAADGGVRLYLDEVKVIDNWTDTGVERSDSATFNSTFTGRHRIRIDYFDSTGNASLKLYYTPPGSGEVLVPGSKLFPEYSLVTTKTTVDATVGWMLERNSYTDASAGLGPEHGSVTSVTQDPGGLNLVTTTKYEAVGTGYLRRTNRFLPAGTTADAATGWSYAYYGDAEPRLNPCPGGTSANQAGALRTRTAPDPDGAGIEPPRIEEFVYDASGRLVASRINAEPWTCRTYDTRGRLLTHDIPAYGGQPARTITNNYAVGGDPLRTSASDSAGTITTVNDLLGRVTSYTDVFGKTTTYTYDQAGRMTDSTGPTGTLAIHTDYDAAGRVTAQKLGGQTVATPTYGAAGGELSSVTYPSGAGNAGNGTSLSSVGRDSIGRVTSLNFTQAGGALLSKDAVTRSQSGKVIDEVIDGVDPYPSGNNFAYDKAGRLTTARVPGHTLNYAYASDSPSCTLAPVAGKNSNRTQVTDNGSTQTYCYDRADKLLSTTDPRYASPGYDPHGNTTTLGSQTLTYDSADRHVATTIAASVTTTVNYTRDAADRIVSRTAVAPKTIAYRSSATAVKAGGGTTLSIAKPAGVASGDLLLAQIAVKGGTSTLITAPAGFTALDSTANSTQVRQGIYYKIASSSEPASYTFSFSANQQAAGAIGAFTGVSSSSPINAFSASTSASTPTLIASSVTPTAEGALAVAAFGVDPGQAVAPPAAMNEAWDRSQNVGVEASTQLLHSTAPTGDRSAVADGLVSSVNHLIALAPALAASEEEAERRYGHSGPGDTADFVTDASGTVIEQTIPLPGGVLLTKRSASEVWSYPNIHGDLIATAGSSGAKQGTTIHYDPFGQVMGEPPDNSSFNFDYGWLGQHLRGYEHAFPIATIEMGARQYVPGLGRFLEVDPIEGGSANDYDYAFADPCNNYDLDGRESHGYRWRMFMGVRCGVALNRFFKFKSRIDSYIRRKDIVLDARRYFLLLRDSGHYQDVLEYCKGPLLKGFRPRGGSLRPGR